MLRVLTAPDETLWATVTPLLGEAAPDLEPLMQLAGRLDIGIVVGTMRDGNYSVDVIDWNDLRNGEPWVFQFAASTVLSAALKAICLARAHRAGE